MNKKRKDVSPKDRWITIMGIILISLAGLSLIAIISYLIIPLICPAINISILPEASVNAMLLSCITLSISLSIVVPWMMSKTQIHGIAEEAVKQYYDKDFRWEIQKTHNLLFRAYANDSRMIAYFLSVEGKPIWALGWICKSSISYDLVHDNNQRGTYTALAVSNVLVLIDCVLKIYEKMQNGIPFIQVLNADNEEKTNEVATRTTRDLVKFCSSIELRDKDYASVFEDKVGRDIPETLNCVLIDFLSCLVRYLEEYHRPSGVSLIERLELNNPDEPNSSIHQAYYQSVEKKCERKGLSELIAIFKTHASSLKELYDEYVYSRYTRP